MRIVKAYWYVRAFLRVGVFNDKPTVGEYTAWLYITHIFTRETHTLEEFKCRECGRTAWRIGSSDVCDNYGCYVKSKTHKKVEVVS